MRLLHLKPALFLYFSLSSAKPKLIEIAFTNLNRGYFTLGSGETSHLAEILDVERAPVISCSGA